MYPGVCRWLEGFLRSQDPRSAVRVADVSRVRLRDFLRQADCGKALPAHWITWDVRVDVLGYIESPEGLELAIAECKNTRLTLSHLSQVVGYSRIVLPRFAFLLSPLGPSDALLSLIATHGRRDILEYEWERGALPKAVVVARWDPRRETIDEGTALV